MGFTIAISKSRVPFRKNIWLIAFIAAFAFVWSNSLIGTTDVANWLIENSLTFIFVLFLFITFKNINSAILVICLFAFIYAYMFMALNIPMMKIHLDTGFRMFFIGREIIMTALYILVLAFYWPILCGRCF